MFVPAEVKNSVSRSGSFYARYGKRAFDIAFSLCALIVLSPLFLVLSIVVAVTSESVLFGQKRYGRNRTVFKMWKYETMTSDTPSEVMTEELKSEDVHFTPCGAFMRKYSLNELPQLVNILKGEMSVVGPRPAMMVEQRLLELRDTNDSNSVRPGLTGWAQVNGRDSLDVAEKARFDGEYCRRMSLAFDLKCIAMTFSRVATAEGVAEEGKGSLADVVDGELVLEADDADA